MRNNPLLYILLYVFTTRSSYVFDNIVSDTIFETIILRLVQLVSIIVIIKYGLKIEYKKPIHYLCIFFFALLISSFRKGTIYNFVADLYPFLSYSILLIWMGQTYSRFKCFVNIVSKFHLVILGGNLFLTIFIPDLFGEKYLLGNENLIGYTFLIGFVYNALDCYMSHTKEKFWTYIILIIINDLLVWSGGTLIGLVVLFSGLYLPIVKNFINKVSLNLLVAAYVGVFVIVVFLNSTGILEGTYVETIIIDFLGKDLTFTGRSSLWLKTIYMITEEPLWGHGIPSDTNIVTTISLSGMIVMLSAHNQFLQTLYEGGICALVAMVPSILYLNKLIKDNRDIFLINLSKSSVLALFFMYLVESPSMNYFFELYVLICVALFFCKKYRVNIN